LVNLSRDELNEERVTVLELKGELTWEANGQFNFFDLDNNFYQMQLHNKYERSLITKQDQKEGK
jgi:hypothetical protein